MEAQNIFQDIEKTGEQFKAEFAKLAKKAQEALESQVNTAKFEAAYNNSLDKKQRIKTMNEVKEIREELWQEALKKANGNINDAYGIYENLCVFP